MRNWRRALADETLSILQGVCGFRARELDIAFLLRQLHQLGLGDRGSGPWERVCGEGINWSCIFKSRKCIMVYDIRLGLAKACPFQGPMKIVILA